MTSKLTEIRYVYHASDIQIHENKRLDEYSQVLDTMYSNMPNENQDSIFIITGSILNNPEHLTYNSLKLLDKIFDMSKKIPIIIIPEKHDALIESLLKTLSAEHKIYFYHEQTYTHGNADSILKKYDYSLLGGMQSHKFLNNEKKIMYAGSLIQQNHSELVSNHGIVKIDLIKQETLFIPIHNNYVFLTLHFNNNRLTDHPTCLANKTKMNLNIKYDAINTDHLFIMETIKKISSVHNVISCSQINISKTLDIKEKLKTTDNSLNLLTEQKSLIRKYLKLTNVDKNTISKIIKLHESIHDQVQNFIPVDYGYDSPVIEIIQIMFDNIMCYGTDNIFDFTRYEDNKVISLSGGNGMGKSAILDAILFGFYGETTREKKNGKDIINRNENNSSCSILFRIGNEEFLIKRHHNINATGGVTSPVKFYKINGNKNELLSSGGSKKTNKMIIEHVGTLDRYLNTTFMTQKNKNNLSSNREFLKDKSLLCKTLDLNPFVPHFNMVEARIKESETNMVSLRSDVLTSSEKLINPTTNITDLLTDEMIYQTNRVKPKIYRHPSLKKYIINSTSDVRCLINNISSPTERQHLIMLEFQMDYYDNYIRDQAELKKIKEHLQLVRLLREKEANHKILLDYKYIVHVNGISLELLKSKLPVLEKLTNKKLKLLDMEQIKILFTSVIDDNTENDEELDCYKSKLRNTEIQIYKRGADCLQNNILSSSGFEKLATEICFRMSMDEIIVGPRIDLFVIDEELNSYDTENLSKVEKLLAMIKEKYKYVINISHEEKILKFSDYIEPIHKEGKGYSFLNNVDENAEPPKIKIVNRRKLVKKEKIIKKEVEVWVL